jgi:nicotinic acid mononucleotide adenylyltransferase
MIFYPGSFKPPHKGHFNNLKYLLKKYKNENILIIISKKERPTNPDFYQLEKQNSNYIKDLCIKYKINYTTKVDSIKLLKNYYLKKKEYVSDKESERLWKIYIDKLLNKNDQKRVKLMISYLNSPILTINSLLKQKSYDKVYLVKSSKNDSNKRFNSFTNSKIKIIVIPELKNISSKDFRENIYKKKNISKYLPSGLSKKNI